MGECLHKLTEKHDDIRDAERDSMDHRPDELLQRCGAKDHKLRWPVGALRLGRVQVLSLQIRPLRGHMVLELSQYRTVVFLADAAQELETHDQQGHADAGRGKRTLGADVPARGEETCRFRKT